MASTKADWARIAHMSIRDGERVRSMRVGDRVMLPGAGRYVRTGANAFGSVRSDPDLAKVDWVGTAHFYDNAGEVTICDGDSGGPALMFAGNVPITFGIASNVSTKDGWCAASGAKQRYAFSDAHAVEIRDYINGVLGTTACVSYANYRPSALGGAITVSTVECSH